MNFFPPHQYFLRREGINRSAYIICMNGQFTAKTTVYQYAQFYFCRAAKINKCNIDHVVIGDGCLVTDSTLKHCVIGICSILGENSNLEDVVMMGADYYQTEKEVLADKAQNRPSIGVGRNCRIRRAIIDKNARIGDGVALSPEGKPDGDYAHDVVIRDGILCVTKGAVIPSGYKL